MPYRYSLSLTLPVLFQENSRFLGQPWLRRGFLEQKMTKSELEPVSPVIKNERRLAPFSGWQQQALCDAAIPPRKPSETRSASKLTHSPQPLIERGTN